MIINLIDNLFGLYFLLIILYCFMSFFPRLDRNSGILGAITAIVEPYLALFRKIIPPVGGLDFSPIIALFVLQVLHIVTCSVLAHIF